MTSITFNGVQIWAINMNSNVKMIPNHFYINQVINKNMITFCKNPPPTELYYPASSMIAPALDKIDLTKFEFCFYSKTGYTSKLTTWIVSIGYYHDGSNTISCILTRNANNTFNVINAQNNQFMATITSDKIYFVKDNQTQCLDEILA